MKARKAKKGKGGGGGGGGGNGGGSEGQNATGNAQGIKPAQVATNRGKEDDEAATGENGNRTAASEPQGLVIHDDD
ncbi:hypothetical protein NLG97_g4875 [Lecanicillium saksenae]|uniref:Uncharacterized protein n=1 Tax=Lecanicillium saksenae TaxID=468837 RepID=A0ACC1QVQ4_9HYPO|nr:hypothetical protein NLG97_g4875 [Lecanicillium saksenae]